ncbi:hypothetical protein LMG28688_06855 [Paraburkholderia caffeinitolerans]|uniref:Uncharacterized protein n=1 Tax=Paraburkholderia caffeinitolerans TaxID=1723730 RepID=A0A6J5H121_9BURK|nr:hypothetical protein LMG28688_06855 [Paraburkholderia caffeinitolerans]
MVTSREQPFSENVSFRRRFTGQSTSIVLPRWAWRETPEYPGSNDVAAQMNAAGDEYYD